MEFNYTNPSLITKTVVDYCDGDLWGTIFPVIGVSDVEVFILYKKNSSTGLQYRGKYWDNSTQQWSWNAPATLPNTNGASCNPSMTLAGSDLHLVWQQGNTEIRYQFDILRSVRTRTFENYNYTCISTGSGNEKNKYPSISLHSSQENPIVSWTGSYKYIAEKSIGKEGAQDIYNHRLVVRTKTWSWGSFYQTGNDVNYSNSSSTNVTTGESVISWSQSSGSSAKWVKRVSGAYGSINNLTYAGLIPHMSGGTNLSNIKTLTFKNNTDPIFYAETDNTDFSQNPLKKSEAVYDLTFGRKGVLFKDSLEFIYNVGDILVNDDVVKFITVEDTVPFNTLTDLNTVLRTENFNLDENAQLYFSNLYRVLNAEYANTILSNDDFVKFSIELIKSADGSVIGEFDPITYSINNLYEKKTKDYQINCAGITSGEYYLRLKVESNMGVSYALGNEYNDFENLEKKHYNSVELFSAGIITTYDLFQNYPNPFNPSTTIRYQIPEDGLVTLKIYDILGREVKALVNDFKTKGRYEVTFDASQLASGLYIYEINSGSFKASKKMTLIK